MKYSLETLTVLVTERFARVEDRFKLLDQALILRTTELEKHLDSLNHQHEKAVADRQDFVTKQVAIWQAAIISIVVGAIMLFVGRLIH